ncbi:MAG: carboxymuconolactone decarboxylase family protein, partial [Actinomycetota bacterium]
MQATLESRLNNAAMLAPDAIKSLIAFSNVAYTSGLPRQTVDLVLLRASQINGCAVCVQMHAADLRKAGETDERLFGVAAWRETPYFTSAERAALALAEAGTRLADAADPVPDEVWDEATQHFDSKELVGLVIA